MRYYEIRVVCKEKQTYLMWTDLFRSWDLNIQSGTKYLKAENFINYVTGRSTGTDFNQTIIAQNNMQTSELVIQKSAIQVDKTDTPCLLFCIIPLTLYIEQSGSKRLCDLPILLKKSKIKPVCQPPVIVKTALPLSHNYKCITGPKIS